MLTVYPSGPNLTELAAHLLNRQSSTEVLKYESRTAHRVQVPCHPW